MPKCPQGRIPRQIGLDLSRGWVETATAYLNLLGKVTDQTERRVFDGETVPAGEKVVSLFEPHTDIIVKGGRVTR